MRIRVRVAVRDEDVVEVVLEFHCEWETAVKAAVFAFEVGSVVTDVVPVAVPTDVFCRGVFLRVKQGFHSHIVQTVRLEQVNDVKPVLYILARVSNRKEVPLRMPVGIKIRREYQIILKLAPNLHQNYFWMTLLKFPHSNRDSNTSILSSLDLGM